MWTFFHRAMLRHSFWLVSLNGIRTLRAARPKDGFAISLNSQRKNISRKPITRRRIDLELNFIFFLLRFYAFSENGTFFVSFFLLIAQSRYDGLFFCRRAIESFFKAPKAWLQRWLIAAVWCVSLHIFAIIICCAIVNLGWKWDVKTFLLLLHASTTPCTLFIAKERRKTIAFHASDVLWWFESSFLSVSHAILICAFKSNYNFVIEILQAEQSIRVQDLSNLSSYFPCSFFISTKCRTELISRKNSDWH